MQEWYIVGVGKVERYPQFRSVLIYREREGPLHCNAFFLHNYCIVTIIAGGYVLSKGILKQREVSS